MAALFLVSGSCIAGPTSLEAHREPAVAIGSTYPICRSGLVGVGNSPEILDQDPSAGTNRGNGSGTRRGKRAAKKLGKAGLSARAKRAWKTRRNNKPKRGG